jgi:hypothetical protein
MTRTVPLYEVATARAGDKGDRSNIAVFVRDSAWWPIVCEQITPVRLSQAYPLLFRGPIRSYRLEHLRAINFVLDEALEGGVNSSLNLDAHGKSFSFLVLDLELSVPEQMGANGDLR